MIEDLLEFSRMEAGRIKLKPEMISVYGVAEKVVEQLAPLAQESNLRLFNRVPEEIALIEADPMRIEQVLTNLISNAIKFTPANGAVSVLARVSANRCKSQCKIRVLAFLKPSRPRYSTILPGR
jgi:signal transduction histidine kinase